MRKTHTNVMHKVTYGRRGTENTECCEEDLGASASLPI